jgi:hypothetical protein
MIDQESDSSDEEESYYIYQRSPLVHQSNVRPQPSQPEWRTRLQATAQEFRPKVAQEIEQIQQQSEGPEQHGGEDGSAGGTPTCCASTAARGQWKYLHVRRSTCTGRPREMFSYDSLGHPSYQSRRQGANAVVLNSYMVPGNTMTYPVLQGGYGHEGTPLVWTC